MRQEIVIKDKAAMLIVMIVFVFMVGLMLACANRPQYKTIWSKPNFTQQEFATDKYECMQQSQQRVSSATGGFCSGPYCVPGEASSKVYTNQDLFKACMEARGWTYHVEKQE
jgi:hypothetical protein